jgi:hypothetical protein
MSSPISQNEDTASSLDAAKPMDEVQPVVLQHGLGAQLVALARYMSRT